jgi:signal transduction histidine kinase
LDNSLTSAAGLELAALHANLPIPLQRGPETRQEFIDALNRFVVVRDPNGAMLATNTPLASELPFDPEAIREAQHGKHVWTTAPWDRTEVRSLYVQVHDSTSEGPVMQIAASMGPLHEAQRYVLFVMLGTALLGAAATWFGVGWLAQSAVAPVGEIADQAEALDPGTVGHRITAHASITEFQGLIRVLNSMLTRLDRAFLAQRRIIADVGHDLRTPITAMQGEIEIALRGERKPDAYRRVLSSVLEEVGRLGSISETLLTLARVEAGELAPRVDRIDLLPLAEAAVRRAEPHADGHRISVGAEGREPPAARADAHLIALVLDQLLDNTIRHTPSGTSASVRVESAPGNMVRVVVEDDGPGLSAEALEHLFERFYRGDTARGRAGGAGAGLGLTVASAIIEAHGGTITAERGERGGLRVVFTLPAAPVEALPPPRA